MYNEVLFCGGFSTVFLKVKKLQQCYGPITCFLYVNMVLCSICKYCFISILHRRLTVQLHWVELWLL